MRQFALVTLVLLATVRTPASAQGQVSGTWQSGGQTAAIFTLAVEGARLSGSVEDQEIYDGRFDGTALVFKVTSPDGDRTITFTGKLGDDQIAFSREVQVKPGGRPGVAGIFSVSAPRDFTATRVSWVAGSEFVAAVNLVSRDLKAEASLFLPERVKNVRAVLVFSTWGLGSSLYADAEWRRLAAELDLGLLRLTVRHVAEPKASLVGPGRIPGSAAAEAVISLLRRVGEASSHAEVANAPLLFWGHSAGGTLATNLSERLQERTVGFVRYHSGRGAGDPIPTAVSRLPALILAGGRDANVGFESARELWRSGRVQGAPWTFAVVPDARHSNLTDLEKTRVLMIPWVAAVVRQRVPANGRTLRAFDSQLTRFGDHQTGEIGHAASGSTSETSWLPDEPSGEGWQAVQRPAPTVNILFFPVMPRNPAAPALGTWRGTIVDGQQSYGVEIQLDRLVPGETAGKTLYFGNVNCGGNLTLLERQPSGVLVFTETIDTPGRVCVNGRVHLRFLDNERFHYEWHAGTANARPTIPPTATLDRKVTTQ